MKTTTNSTDVGGEKGHIGLDDVDMRFSLQGIDERAFEGCAVPERLVSVRRRRLLSLDLDLLEGGRIVMVLVTVISLPLRHRPSLTIKKKMKRRRMKTKVMILHDDDDDRYCWRRRPPTAPRGQTSRPFLLSSGVVLLERGECFSHHPMSHIHLLSRQRERRDIRIERPLCASVLGHHDYAPPLNVVNGVMKVRTTETITERHGVGVGKKSLVRRLCIDNEEIRATTLLRQITTAFIRLVITPIILFSLPMTPENDAGRSLRTRPFMIIRKTSSR